MFSEPAKFGIATLLQTVFLFAYLKGQTIFSKLLVVQTFTEILPEQSIYDSERQVCFCYGNANVDVNLAIEAGRVGKVVIFRCYRYCKYGL